jgi:hypothetical protein
MKPDRHGFFQNRHGYFTNPSVYPRIDGMEPAACDKKAVFGTVPAGDLFSDRPAIPEMMECAVLRSGPGLRNWKSHGNDPIPIRAVKYRIETDKHQIKFFRNNITGS